MFNVRFTLRLLGLGVGIIAGIVFGNALRLMAGTPDSPRALVTTFAVTIGAIGYLLGPHLTPKLLSNLKQTIKRASTLDIAAVGIGLFFGALISAAFAIPLSFLPGLAGSVLPLLCAAVMIRRSPQNSAPLRHRVIRRVSESPVIGLD